MSKSSSSDNKFGEDDVVKLCPLCKAAVRFFFVNFTEKVLLCENEFCNYPLGIENLQFIKVDTGINLDAGASGLARHNISGSSALLDFDKLNEVFESTKNELLNVKPINLKRKKIPDMYIANNKETKKNVQDLKYLTMELNETDQVTDVKENDFIKNQKWLKKLMKLQVSSGVKLVKKGEIKLLKQETPAFGGGELKIDIDTDGDRTTLEDVT